MALASTSTDGGGAALAGFVFQLLGSASSFVEIIDSPNPDQISAEVLLLEFAGQDATIGRRIIQFKYSLDPQKYAIDPGGFVEIIDKLKEAQQVAFGTQAENPVLELQTNRPLSESAQAAYNGEAPLRSPASDAEAQNLQTIRDNRNAIKFTLVNPTKYVQSLEQLAEKYGVLPNEWDVALSRILGGLVRKASAESGPRKMTQAEFLRLLVGHPLPGSLHAGDRLKEIRQALMDMAAGYGEPAPDTAVSRDALAQLSKLVTEPVVLVYGRGGCGKTLSILQYCNDWIQVPPSRFVDAIFLGAREWKDPASIVHKWQNGPAGFVDTNYQRALDRLAGANGAIRPALILLLDGVDEADTNQIAMAQQLISFFQRLPRLEDVPMAQLIVTCRTRAHFEDLCIYISGTGGSQPKIPDIMLDEFTEDELKQAWTTNLNEPFPINLDTVEGNSPELRRDARRLDPNANHLPGHIALLKHPALFGVFKNLDPATRKDYLDHQSTKAQTALAKGYVHWFCAKTARRQQRFHNVINSVLQAVAQNVGDHFDRDKDWIALAQKSTGETNMLLRNIFNDATNCGLIETPEGPNETAKQSSVNWWWRFDFVRSGLLPETGTR